MLQRIYERLRLKDDDRRQWTEWTSVIKEAKALRGPYSQEVSNYVCT
jgi:hypothetical protein